MGLVQGLTEFLPISSSGHLVVAEAAVGLTTPGVMVEVVLHVATVFAVLIVYRVRLWELFAGAVRGQRAAWHYLGLLVIGTIPAAFIGFLFADLFERAFDSLFLVGVDFTVTGLILWSTRRVVTRAEASGPTSAGAAGVGFAQAFAILPGISRSGTTVAAALWLGVEPVRAAEFSFLLAIPAIAGAAVLELPRLSTDVTAVGTGPLVVSFLGALVAGVLAIRFLVALLRQRAFHRFAPYCWMIGGVTMVWALIR